MRKRDLRRAVLAEWGFRFALMNRLCVLPAHAYALHLADDPNRPPAQREQILQMASMLEPISRLFSRPGPLPYRQIPRYQKAIEQFCVISHDLAQWGDVREALEIWERFFNIAKQDVAFFRELVSLPLLERQANWTEADNPIPYLKEGARNRKRDEKRAEWARRRREVPLDEAALEDADALRTLQSAPDESDALDELTRILFADAQPDVKAYGELRTRERTHEEARRELGWYKKRAHRAEVAYRRLLKRAREDPKVKAARRDFALHHDSSRTVVRRTFKAESVGPRGEREGRLLGYYEPRPGWKDDPKTGK